MNIEEERGDIKTLNTSVEHGYQNMINIFAINDKEIYQINKLKKLLKDKHC